MIIMETRSTLIHRLQLHVPVHTLYARFICLKCVIPRFMYPRTLPWYTMTSYPPGRVCIQGPLCGNVILLYYLVCNIHGYLLLMWGRYTAGVCVWWGIRRRRRRDVTNRRDCCEGSGKTYHPRTRRKDPWYCDCCKARTWNVSKNTLHVIHLKMSEHFSIQTVISCTVF